MTYSFVISRRAGQDFHTIVNWLKKQSPVGAEAWRFALADCLAEVIKDPYRYSKAAEGSNLPHGVREALFSTPRGNTYRIVFLVEQSDVRILRIRGPVNAMCGGAT